jgi:hypothetical protein
VGPTLDPETHRLYLSTVLTTQAARSIGRVRIAADSDASHLLALARNLGAERVERTHRLSFEPCYPGITAGVQRVSGGLRLLLACRASYHGGEPLGVVFTSLFCGRSRRVCFSPVGSSLPEVWLTSENQAADLFLAFFFEL